MSETANYGLYTTDDSSERFQDWRRKINGVEDSNMVKIDGILARKAEVSRPINKVLSVDGWEGDAAPFTQTIPIEGLTAQYNGVADVAPDISDEQYRAACAAKLRISGQADGSLVISAKGIKPSCDIPIIIMLIG